MVVAPLRVGCRGPIARPNDNVNRNQSSVATISFLVNPLKSLMPIQP
jgi:hypothetical protein